MNLVEIALTVSVIALTLAVCFLQFQIRLLMKLLKLDGLIDRVIDKESE